MFNFVIMFIIHVCSLVIGGFLITPLCGFNLDTDHTVVYEDPSEVTGRRGSYFGFSVLLYSGDNSGTKSWIQIGAPRGNDSILYYRVKEPGMVFRCPIKNQCNTVPLDLIRDGSTTKAVLNGNYYQYTDMKRGAWIGGAMDIDEDGKRVIVCGHRWRNKKENTNNQFNFMVGVCYLSLTERRVSNPAEVSKLLPLINEDRYFHEANSQGFSLLHYGDGQAGVSVHFPRNTSNSDILIGAPGLSNWRGSAIRYRTRQTLYADVLESKYQSGIGPHSLFGYQVNSGKFMTNKLYYVAGNPKEANYKGRVVLFTHNDDNGFKIVKSLNGYQTGEYFGSSIAVADVNCDGIDDLIVGAPQYTVTHDEGSIYIFYSNLRSTIFNNPIMIVGKKLGARFGSTITALGDLDNDGCADIGVGAPYENNTGAVYIYNGGTKGLTLTQEIFASDIGAHVRGFGISISRAVDIDGNNYPDVAVGAYLSEQVVLFRGMPVVILKTEITPKVPELQKDATSFFIEVCLSYEGKYAPASLNVSRTIVLDERYQRAHFMNKRNTKKSEHIIKNNKFCQDIEVFLIPTALDENTFDPITVKVSQELIQIKEEKTIFLIGRNYSAQGMDGFRSNSPVVNEQKSAKNASVNVPFMTECAGRDRCDAELQLQSSFSGIMNNEYIIGSKSQLKLEISLVNFGEPAYMTVVNITIPSPLYLSSGYKNCKEKTTEEGLLMYCSFGNPLRNGTLRRNLTLSLDTGGLKTESKTLTFFVSAHTSSNDKNARMNSQQLQLNLVVEADVSITGRSEELTYYFAKSNKTIFKHRYEIQRWGSSPIDVAEVKLNIPVRMKNSEYNATFLDLYSPAAYLNAEQPLTCSVQDFDYFIDVGSDNMQGFEGLAVSARKKRQTENVNVTAIEQQMLVNDTLFLNCSTPDVECVTVTCDVGPFDSDTQASASIDLKMILNTTNLGSVLGMKNKINFSTDGFVSIKMPEITKVSNRSHYIIVNSTFLNVTQTEATAKRVATWIIALAIIAGVLIFMFVVIGLMKAGFFERKKKEELKSLMAIYAENVFTTGPVVSVQENQEQNEQIEQIEQVKQNEDEQDGESL